MAAFELLAYTKFLLVDFASAVNSYWTISHSATDS